MRVGCGVRTNRYVDAQTHKVMPSLGELQPLGFVQPNKKAVVVVVVVVVITAAVCWSVVVAAAVTAAAADVSLRQCARCWVLSESVERGDGAYREERQKSAKYCRGAPQ